MNTKNFQKEQEANRAIQIVVDLAKGYFITFLAIIIYSALLTFTNMTDSYIMFVVLATTILATSYIGYQFAKKSESRGLLWGILGGLAYGLIFIALGFFASEVYALDSRTLFVLLFSVVSGGMGGIIGINSKK